VIDFHCHLDLYPDPAGVIDDCRRRGLYVLCVTTTPTAWKGTSALAEHAPRIRTALGLHPQLAHERRGELPLFDELLPQIHYVGEVGLDGAPESRPHWHAQVAVFEHILATCSAAGGRIMSLHSRRASDAVLAGKSKTSPCQWSAGNDAGAAPSSASPSASFFLETGK